MGLSSILPPLLGLLLAVCTTAGPVERPSEVVITTSFFEKANLKYTGEHDIVNILVPLNRINFDVDDDETDPDNIAFFFTEADIDEKGGKQYQGLYIFKDGKATKVLANGRDAAALDDHTKKVYIGASDGIYVYDDGKTKKYGALTDSIIRIGADNQTGTIYFLTEDHELFSVADAGVKKNKIEAVSDVRGFVIDYLSNIYYYDSQNQLHVYNQEGVKKFDGLTLTSIKLVRPMYNQKEGVFGILNDELYALYPNGTAVSNRISLEVKPTAYSAEATLLQYYGFDKKIYEYNVMKLLSPEVKNIKDYLNEKKDDNQTKKSASPFE